MLHFSILLFHVWVFNVLGFVIIFSFTLFSCCPKYSIKRSHLGNILLRQSFFYLGNICFLSFLVFFLLLQFPLFQHLRNLKLFKSSCHERLEHLRFIYFFITFFIFLFFFFSLDLLFEILVNAIYQKPTSGSSQHELIGEIFAVL